MRENDDLRDSDVLLVMALVIPLVVGAVAFTAVTVLHWLT